MTRDRIRLGRQCACLFGEDGAVLMRCEAHRRQLKRVDGYLSNLARPLAGNALVYEDDNEALVLAVANHCRVDSEKLLGGSYCLDCERDFVSLVAFALHVVADYRASEARQDSANLGVQSPDQGVAQPSSPNPEATTLPEGAAIIRELVDAMRRYEMDVDEVAPYTHRMMMERAERWLASQSAVNAT